ncbi:MAG TPA: glycosyltransferase family 39 protein [Opitutaceae bacterium]|nr:glycosyltransferase family 39 protein [Opitutaceae bacterium]
MPRRLLLLFLTTALALVLGYLTFTPLQAVNLVHHGGYWLLLGTTAWFAWHLIRSLRDTAEEWRVPRRWWPAAVLIVGLAGWLHVHEEHGFKIVADEVLLSSTARQMHFHRETAVILRGYDYAGNFTPMNVFLDKRPLLFPFLLCTLHDLTGYRVGNVFVLNGLLSLALVGLTYLVGRRMGGPWAGTAAALLLCGVPLVAQNATGGGFELLNMVMLVMVLWLGQRFVERPADEDRLGAFILGGVLLAQVRYESVLFVLPVGLTVIYTWWRERRLLLPGPLLAAPLLLVIWPLHHNVFKLSEAAWQLFDIAGATDPFGIGYFYDNIGHAMNFFFTADGSQPSSWPLAVLGVLSCGLFMLLLYKEHRTLVRDPAGSVVVIFVLGLLVHTAVMLCYFWGKWDDPVIRRLSLPAHVLLVVAVLFVWPRLLGVAWRWPALAALGAVIFFSLTVPASAMHRFTRDNFAARTTNWLGGYIRQLQDKRVLAIDNNAGLQWFLYAQSSVNPARLSESWEGYAYHFRIRTFDDYFVVQRVGHDLRTGEKFVSWEDDIGPAFELELIEEKAFAPMYLVRLSRVKAVDEEKLKAWAAERKKAHAATVKTTVPLPVADADQLADWMRKLP